MKSWECLEYMIGMDGEKLSESIEGSVPRSNINPQKCPLGLYAEQLSGTSFTTPRVNNRRIWFYRILPSVKHESLKKCEKHLLKSDFRDAFIVPDQLRWAPLPFPKKKKRFYRGSSYLCWFW